MRSLVFIPGLVSASDFFKNPSFQLVQLRNLKLTQIITQDLIWEVLMPQMLLNVVKNAVKQRNANISRMYQLLMVVLVAG